MSRYGFLRMKFLLVVLPIIALSFLVHAAFDARIAFAEQIAADTLNLKLLTDSIGVDNKLSRKLDRYLDSSLDALEHGVHKLRDEDDKSRKPKKSKKSKKDEPGDKDFRRAQQNLDRYIDTLARELKHDKITQVQVDVLEPVALAIRMQFATLLSGDFDNLAPSANAGADQAVDVMQMVTLDGSASSDPDGDALSYQWSLNPPTGNAAVLSAADTATPSLVPDLPGAYVVELVVSDGLLDSAADSVTVNASTPNTLPVADAGADQTGSAGDMITLDGSAAADADGDALSYSWTLVTLPASSIASLDSATAVMPTFVADIAGVYEAELVVNDGLSSSVPARVTVNISIPNTSPVANAGPDQSVAVGDIVQLDGHQSSDVDGHGLVWFWSLILKPSGSSAELDDPSVVNPEFFADVEGQYLVQLVVNDGEDDSAADSVLVNAITPNTIPVADAGPDQSDFVGALIALDGSASIDADDELLSYDWSLISAPPDSSTVLSDAGAVNPTFVIDASGIYTVQLVVNDGQANSAPDQVVITTLNSRPVADAGPDQVVTLGSIVQFDGSDSGDADNDALGFEWSLLSQPDDSMATLFAPGTVNPTLDADRIGYYLGQLIVSDGVLDSAPDSVSIQVNPLADIAILLYAPQDGLVTNQLTINFIGSLSHEASLTINDAPMPVASDLSFDYAVTLVDGDNFFDLFAIDVVGTTANLSRLVTLDTSVPPVPSDGLIVVSLPDVNGLVTISGESGSVEPNATVIITNLRTGAVFSALADATGAFSAVLNGLEGDAYRIEVQDAAGNQSGSVEVTNEVVQLPPTITSTPTIGATIDQLYSYQVIAEDPNGDVLSFELDNKPLGMNVNAAGLVIWTPINDGNFAVTIRVSDGRGNEDTQSYSILVEGAAALTPTLGALIDQTALLGRTLNLQLSASDSNNDAIEFFVGPLPLAANMTLDSFSGLFSFTPEGDQVGNYPLKFMATDGRFYAEQTITITVPPPAGVTQLRGQVLTLGDAPLPGVRFEMGGVETVSDANGDFFLDNIPVSGNVRLLVDGNAVDPALGAFATVPEMIPVIAGTENLLEPAIFLLPLDVASADPVDPDLTSIVTSSRFIEGLEITEPVTLTIPPGAAIDDATQMPFVGDIHISRVTDPSKGPRPLPEAFDLSVYIAIQPFGVTYPNPVPISFPNVEKFAPDTRMDFFALNHETGVMEKIGEGLVSADGKTVDSIGGVVKSNSWHGIVPQGPVATPSNAPNQSEPGGYYGGGSTGGGNSGGSNPNPDAPDCNNGCLIDEETGNLKEWHHVPAYSSLSVARSIRLEYNSNLANANPILPLISGFGNRAAPPDLMSMRINIDGIDMGRDIFSEVRIEPSNIRGQFKTTRPAIQFNATMIDTGIYNYELDINCYFPISRRQETVSDQIIIHNERNSSFGAGWTIAGLQRVYPHSNGRVMLTEGTASSLIFDPLDPIVDPNGFESPAGDFSTLTRLGDGTLERRMKNGTRFRFDADGLMTQALDRNNNLTTYLYDTAQRLTSIVDPVGKSFKLTYAAGKLDTVSDPLDRVTRFEHDSEGNLIAIVEPNGDRRKFEYSPGNNRMIAQTDQRENRTQYFYDFAGRISETLLPDGSNPKFSPGQTKGVANPAAEGQVGDGSRELPTPAPLLVEDLNNTYTDHNGNESSEVTDLRHKPIRIKDALDRTYEYERDEDSNRTKRVRPNGSVVDNTFDDRGNQLTRTEQFNSAFYQYSYDAFSQVTSYTNPNSHTTTFNRDPANGNLTSLVNHLGHTTTYEYDSRGLVERIVTPNQLEVTFTYSPQGQVQTMTETPPAGSPGNTRLTQYSYDPAGQLTQVITPDGITVDVDYDDKGRRTRATDNLDQAVEYSYDAHDNLVQTDTRNGDGSLALTVENVFDTRNRYFESRAPHLGAELSETTLGLDNNSNVIDLTDPNENAASNEYDEEDRLRKNTHRLDGITLYEYDTNDRVTQVTAPNGVVTRYSYDVLGRKLTETSADRGTLLYSYDQNNNLASITDGRGIETTLSYDELERVDIKTFPNTVPGKIEDVDYIYDDCPFGVGRLCERHDESGTWRYEYDVFGNLVQETRIELGVTYVTEYEYDDGDNISRITYPTGRAVNITRDGVRRVQVIDTDINGVSTDIVSNIQYRADNRMTQCTFGNGLVDNRSYDLQGRLLNQSLSSIDNRVYTYDRNSNMLSRATTPQTSVYGYDALDRLTNDQIDTDDPFIYQYDLNHNREAKTQSAALGENYDYESSSNRLVRHNQFSEASLPATVSERQYVYSDSNRIFKVVDDGLLNAEYIYNDVGLRTRKVVYDNSVTPSVAATTIYHYDLMGYLIAETDQAGVSSKEYIWTEGMTPVAQIDVDGAVDTAHYLHTDHLMTARFATTSSQDVSWRWEGEAFGGSDDQGVQTKINLRFPGQYFDQETGEHYNWNRYYRPGTGRYLTSDPIGLNGGGNTYGYVTGNSIGSYDSYGLFGMDDVWGGLYTVTGGWEPSQSTIDVSAGFGDGVSTVLSFGTYSTNDLRNDLGISGGIDRCSNSYNYSKYAGYAWGAGTAWAGGLVGGSNSVFWSGRGAAARAAQYGTSLERTPIGATLNWLGQSVAIPYPVWQVASATFAANARGSAIKVGAEAGNMWRTIEQPILRVRNIVINHVP